MPAQNPQHEQPQDEVQHTAQAEQNGSLSNQDKDEAEHVVIDMSILQCAICRGVIQKTITLMECFHKFCKECIEKSMSHGVNECPVCHVHVAGQMSLKEDPQYDALVSAIVHKKKDQEVALHLHERTNAQEANFQQSNTSISREQARRNRLAKLVDLLRNSELNAEELDTHLVLVSLDEQKIPSLEEPHLLCRPTCSVKTLCKHVALKSELLENQVELLLVEESAGNNLSGNILIEESGGNIVISDIKVDPNKHKLRVLRGEETLGQLYTPNLTNCGHLFIAYKLK